MLSAHDPITRLLREAHGDNREAIDALLPVVYDELRAIARQQRYQWRGADTLSTTALVHEAYMKLVGGAEVDWKSRRHFFQVAVKAMRYILLDYAKAKGRAKRGGDAEHVDVDQMELVADEEAEELVALHEALTRLEAINTRQSQVVECRFFAGLSIEETAAVLNLSESTVKRSWTVARAWLYREIQRSMAA